MNTSAYDIGRLTAAEQMEKQGWLMPAAILASTFGPMVYDYGKEKGWWGGGVAKPQAAGSAGEGVLPASAVKGAPAKGWDSVLSGGPSELEQAYKTHPGANYYAGGWGRNVDNQMVQHSFNDFMRRKQDYRLANMQREWGPLHR
jgi:hypothetical protein